MAQQYGDKVQFVVVYVVEPHPLTPDPSPYRGDPWQLSYSTEHQPLNYSAREVLAKQAATHLAPQQLLLIDDLTPNGPNNPFWCTYGPVPNGQWAIAQNGTVVDSLDWFEKANAEAAIRRLAGMGPAPAPPPGSCDATEQRLCGDTVGNKKKCHQCYEDNEAAITAAGCTMEQFKAFCGF